MSGLRVIPARLHGRERLYVCRADGADLAWYDRETARVSLLNAEREAEVLDVLGPFLTGPVTVGPPPVPTPAELARLSLHPDDDLAPNRPGEALLVALDRDPGPAHRLRRDPRRRALAAEELTGRSLDRLDGAGRHTLHSVPLPGGDRIHHLVIGPGGVFAVHVLPARGQRVRVDDPLVALGRRAPVPLLDRVRADARRACCALTAEVRPVLVPVGAADVDVTVAPREVRVLAAGELPGLARWGGVLKPADVEALHALARDRTVWTRV
ncbi:nuclease-related domain-containing protein [Streptomyces sp. NPDC032940]|uniref:nuclease-related domain-containing protein n=1 Tax=Streptomyces sp. NPDC032940 TaxID=3155366 RepID=UPI0033FFBF29